MDGQSPDLGSGPTPRSYRLRGSTQRGSRLACFCIGKTTAPSQSTHGKRDHRGVLGFVACATPLNVRVPIWSPWGRHPDIRYPNSDSVHLAVQPLWQESADGSYLTCGAQYNQSFLIP